jgi:hypothetical protein
MRLDAVGRMVIAPAGLAVAVGAVLGPVGPVAVLIGFAVFVAAQLGVLARSHRRLETAMRRLEAARARRQRRA